MLKIDRYFAKKDGQKFADIFLTGIVVAVE